MAGYRFPWYPRYIIMDLFHSYDTIQYPHEYTNYSRYIPITSSTAQGGGGSFKNRSL
jgi:hypothetical protein